MEKIRTLQARLGKLAASRQSYFQGSSPLRFSEASGRIV
jgi:hypothetical protein